MDWRDINNSLPDPGERVLIACGISVLEAWLGDGGKWHRIGVNDVERYMKQKVTHWMPLPEPPEVYVW